jgi:hypothetical protein
MMHGTERWFECKLAGLFLYWSSFRRVVNMGIDLVAFAQYLNEVKVGVTIFICQLRMNPIGKEA